MLNADEERKVAELGAECGYRLAEMAMEGMTRAGTRETAAEFAAVLACQALALAAVAMAAAKGRDLTPASLRDVAGDLVGDMLAALTAVALPPGFSQRFDDARGRLN